MGVYMHVRRFLNAFSVLLLALVATVAPRAEDDFLFPDQAFRISGAADGPDAVLVSWDVADDYYLYRSKFKFRSKTTGDKDGVDLWLDQARRGKLTFESRIGSCVVALEDQHETGDRQVFDLGGLGLGICVERYPERLVDLSATLDCEVQPPADHSTPYLVKTVQSDGHMAWSSPIYIA